MSGDIAKLGIEVTSATVVKADKRLDNLAVTSAKTQRALKGLTGASRQVRAANDNMARSTGVAAAAINKAKLAILAFSAAIGIAAVSSYRKFIANSVTAQSSLAQLESVLKSTKHAAGLTSGELVKMSQSLQGVTNFGDEAIQTAQGVLLTFTKIGKDAFQPATEAVLDMATALRMDLKSAAILVGKALNDPVLGATALSRSGIQFTKVQKEMIKQMVKAGDVAGAQALIMGELETQFKGSAKAARDTLGGALKSLGNVWGDLFEISKKGTSQMQVAVESLIGVLSTDRIKKTFQDIGTALLDMTAGFIDFVAAVTEIMPTIIKLLKVALITTTAWLAVLAGGAIAAAIGQMVALQIALGATSTLSAVFAAGMVAARAAVVGLTAAMMANPIGLIAVGLTTAGAALTVFRHDIKLTSDGFVTLGDAYNGVISLMRDKTRPVTTQIADWWGAAIDRIKAKFGEIAPEAAASFTGIGPLMQGVATNMLAALIAPVTAITESWSAIPGAMASFMAQGADSVISITARMVSVVIGLINKVKIALNSAVSSAKSFLTSGYIMSKIPWAKKLAASMKFAAPTPTIQPYEISSKVASKYEGMGEKLGNAMKTGWEKGVNKAGELTEATFAKINAGMTALEDRARSEAYKRTTPFLEYMGAPAGSNAPGAGVPARIAPTVPTIPIGGGGGGGGGGGAANQADEFRDANAALQEYMANVQRLNTLLAAGKITNEQYAGAFQKIREEYLRTRTDFMAGVERGFISAAKSMGTWASNAEKTITGMFSKAEDALVGFVTTGKIDFKKLIDSMISDLARMMIRMLIMKPLAKMFGGLFGGMFGGTGGLFAKGGVFNGGAVQPFASGGVVNSPTMFQFAKGGTPSLGVMGEAGAEAILPLRRGSDGRLGVSAANSGGIGMVKNEININVEGGSSGDAEQDQELAERISATMLDALDSKIDDRIYANAQYGGSLNPRGA